MEWRRGHILGRGSSAVVSLATSASGNIFAVKSCELSQSEILQREQKFLSVLSSPYLVGYKGCDITKEDNKLMYNLFIEYVPCGTVIDAIRDHGGKINEPMIAHYTKQIVHGLEYLHSHGVVHCDIKGRNILIGENGATKIADLGCAKWANEGASIGGTPMYMSPEVARGEEQGFAADIWALGCTIIEMATGESPWPNNVYDPLSILYKIAFSGEYPEIPNFLSDQANDFLSKCLRRDQTERWTAKELLNHPFIGELNSQSKQNEEFITSSPTSILDQDIWNSIEEETETCARIDQSQLCLENSAGQRIEQLACSSGKADWRWEETWTIIRSNSGDDDEWEGRSGECGPVTGWVGDDMEGVEFNVSGIKKKIVSSSNSLLDGWCTCVEHSDRVGFLINLERCNVPLLLQDQS